VFKSMWASIKSAKRRIWIEIYQLTPDKVGLTTINLLAEAALRGVHVVLLYDGMGSYSLRDHHLLPLSRANATVLQYHKPFTYFQFPWAGRNHRKIVIVDDDVAYCGGMNIGGDYAGTEVGGNGRFYDAHCAIRGPAHTHLVNVFLSSVKNTSIHEWERLKQWCQKRRSKKQFKRFENNVFVQVLDSDVRQKRWNIQKSLLLSFTNAKKSCDVMTPYFLPPKSLKVVILKATERGVKVRLVTQGICKTPLINLASQHIYGTFLKAGVEVYQMYHQELHAKMMVVDDMYCSIGTFNFDHLSFQANLEVNLAILDPDNAHVMKDQFESGIQKCRQLTLEEWERRPWWQKLVHWMAYVACSLVLR